MIAAIAGFMGVGLLVLSPEAKRKILETKSTGEIMPKYVLWGRYCENVVEKRAPYREAHLQGLQVQQAQGTLVTLGPTTDTTRVFGIYQAESEATVRQLVEGDPYWQNGIWTEYEIYEWIQAF